MQPSRQQSRYGLTLQTLAAALTAILCMLVFVNILPARKLRVVSGPTISSSLKPFAVRIRTKTVPRFNDLQKAFDTAFSGLKDKVLSDYLHKLKLSFATNDKRQSNELLKTIIGSSNLTVFKDSSFQRTKNGIRCRVISDNSGLFLGAESHKDQLLGMLGELGIGLDEKIVIGDSKGLLRDLLADSVANFQLTQAEIEWTATAYSTYLYRFDAWQNKFGQTFTFDQLAYCLVGRTKDNATHACCNTHLYYSMCVLLAVNDEHSCLSSSGQRMLMEAIAEAIRKLSASQKEDGSWDKNWNRMPATTEVISNGSSPPGLMDLLITGHTLEWLSRCPKSVAVPESILYKARLYIRNRLDQYQMISLKRTDVCPVVHAIIGNLNDPARSKTTKTY